MGDEPELTRTMAASVQQRIAFGEQAGQKVQRLGSGFGDVGEAPTFPGPRCASMHGFSLHVRGGEDTASPHWNWARLLKRIFALDMAHCPWCQEGSLRIIAAITQGEVIRKIFCHLKLAADPPPIASMRVSQEAFA